MIVYCAYDYTELYQITSYYRSLGSPSSIAPFIEGHRASLEMGFSLAGCSDEAGLHPSNVVNIHNKHTHNIEINLMIVDNNRKYK